LGEIGDRKKKEKVHVLPPQLREQKNSVTFVNFTNLLAQSTNLLAHSVF